jgi:hypothetical protein
MRPVFLPYSQGRLGIVSRGNGQNLLSPLKRLLARSFIFPRRKNNPRLRLIGLPKTMKTPKMGRVNPAPSFFPNREQFFAVTVPNFISPQFAPEWSLPAGFYAPIQGHIHNCQMRKRR